MFFEVIIAGEPPRFSIAEVNALWRRHYHDLMREWNELLENVPSCMDQQVAKVRRLNEVLDRLRFLVNILPSDAPQPPRPRDLLGNWPDELLEAMQAAAQVPPGMEMCGPNGEREPPGPCPDPPPHLQAY